MNGSRKLIPIYTSHGAVGAYLVYPYLYNTEGEWIGWVNAEKEVHSVNGRLVGFLTPEPRILRTREWGYKKASQQPPQAPKRIRTPAQAPFAPPLPELANNMVDVLENISQNLPSLDFGDFQDDLE